MNSFWPGLRVASTRWARSLAACVTVNWASRSPQLFSRASMQAAASRGIDGSPADGSRIFLCGTSEPRRLADAAVLEDVDVEIGKQRSEHHHEVDEGLSRSARPP